MCHHHPSAEQSVENLWKSSDFNCSCVKTIEDTNEPSLTCSSELSVTWSNIKWCFYSEVRPGCRAPKRVEFSHHFQSINLLHFLVQLFSLKKSPWINASNVLNNGSWTDAPGGSGVFFLITEREWWLLWRKTPNWWVPVGLQRSMEILNIDATLWLKRTTMSIFYIYNPWKSLIQ